MMQTSSTSNSKISNSNSNVKDVKDVKVVKEIKDVNVVKDANDVTVVKGVKDVKNNKVIKVDSIVGVTSRRNSTPHESPATAVSNTSSTDMNFNGSRRSSMAATVEECKKEQEQRQGGLQRQDSWGTMGLEELTKPF